MVLVFVRLFFVFSISKLVFSLFPSETISLSLSGQINLVGSVLVTQLKQTDAKYLNLYIRNCSDWWGRLRRSRRFQSKENPYERTIWDECGSHRRMHIAHTQRFVAQLSRCPSRRNEIHWSTRHKTKNTLMSQQWSYSTVWKRDWERNTEYRENNNKWTELNAMNIIRRSLHSELIW